MSLRQHHLTGLDGLRALAVGSVVAYHLGFSFARGGYLGVDLFFVLSGFLITSLLLEEHAETGRVAFAAFWRRRARRLLPALYVVLTVVCLWPVVVGHLVGPSAVASLDVHSLRGYALATLGYVTNWYVVGSGNSYFAHFAAPSPLAHTWSLAIEEQFYVLWPLITVALVRGGIAARRKLGLTVTATAGVVSALLLTLLFNPSDPTTANFVYNATHTRLFDLAAGATLAWWTASRPDRPSSRVTNVVGLGALVLLLGAMVTVGSSSGTPWNAMFEGGLAACAVLAAAVVAAVRDERSVVSRIFSWGPLRYVGNVSYGLYLWHWPIIVLVTPAVVHVGGKKLLLVRVVAMIAATLLSYYLLELPIRERRWSLSWRRVVMVVGTLATVVALIVGTSTSLLPKQSLRNVVARYAPSEPPIGSGGIVGLAAFRARHLPPPTAARPLHVGSVGDSMPFLNRFGMAAALRAIPHVTFTSGAYPGWSLTTTFPWRTSVGNYLRRNPVDVLLVSTTWDDTTARRHPEQFAQTYDEFVRFVLARGVSTVIFDGFPLRHTAQFDLRPPTVRAHDDLVMRQGHDQWRRLVLQLVARTPGVTMFFPLDRVFAPKGVYSVFLAPPKNPTAPVATWDRVRMMDGTHLCAPGVEIYAAALQRDVVMAWQLRRPTASWWTAPWYLKKTDFEVGHGQFCPLNHP